MAVPVVTCDAKIVVAWNENAGSYNAALSATATGSPTGWVWTILSVPAGLEALLTGTWGDFIDGVAVTVAGDASAVALDGIVTNVVAGTIVIQAVASNAEGPSVPATDKANGQQCVVIEDMQGRQIPGDQQYNWGEGQLNQYLRSPNAWGLTPVGPIYEMTYDASVGELVTMCGPIL